MARLAGTAGDVTIAAGSVTGIKSWTLDYVAEALDTTGFDSSGVRTYIPGLKGWSGSFEGYKNGAPSAIGAEVALVLKESATATQKFNGQAIITGLSANTSVDGIVTYSYSFTGTGALTVATA